MNAAITRINIVLLGQFKPDNFLPNKLAEAKVISQKAAESASITMLIPKQSVQFKLDWFELDVLESRLTIHSSVAPYIRICDFVLKALGEMAPDSRVTQFGINVDCHYDLGSADARNSFGRRIAPPEPWGTWGKSMLDSMSGENKGTFLQGGMINLTMRQPFVESDGLTGWRDISVKASPEVSVKSGVMFSSNHHHQIKSIAPDGSKTVEPTYDAKTSTFLLDALYSRFEKSIDDAITIFGEVLAS